MHNMTDEKLLESTLKLVKREKEIWADILLHLEEIERRALYSDLKCTSLFDYCQRILGYSPDSAQRRIVASSLIGEAVKSNVMGKDDKEAQLSIFESVSNVTKSQAQETLIGQREKLGLEKKAPKADKVTKTQSQISRIHADISDETMELLERVKGKIKSSDYDRIFREMALVYLEEKTPKKKPTCAARPQTESNETKRKKRKVALAI